MASEDDAKQRDPTIMSRRHLAISGVGAAAALGAAQARSQSVARPAEAPVAAAARGAILSVLDFGADPSGRNDSTAAFRRALNEAGGRELHIPAGRFLVQGLGGLGPAGQKLVGSSRWKTVLLSEAGAGPIFANEVASRSTSAFHLISDLTVDLNGNDAIAIELASTNCSTIQRVHFRGREGGGRGVGLRFAAPLDKGAYDNAVADCSFEQLAIAVQWDGGANNNSVFNCRIINCGVGLHAAPSRPVDTPRVFGGRVERCRIGLIEGSQCGAYFAIRFENNELADIRFTEKSANAGIWGGFSATTRLTLLDVEKASSPQIEASDLGHLSIEESDARPKLSTGRHVFAKAGKQPAVPPMRDFAAFFSDQIVLRNQVGVEFANPAGTGSMVGMVAMADGTLSIPGYDRATQQHVTINLGGGPAVRPLTDGGTDLGSSGRRYRAAHLAEGVYVGGQRVLRARQPGISNDPSRTPTAETINQVLTVLRHHGLIEE